MMRELGWFVRLLAVFGLGLAGVTACGEDQQGSDAAGADKDTVETETGEADVDDATDDAIPDAKPEVPLDITGDEGISGKTDVIDAVTDIDAGCVTDDQCIGKVTVTGCQMARCDLATGTCIAAPKPNTCCLDSDCNDNNKCTIDKCDTATNQCQNAPDLKECPCGSQTGQKLLQVGFEQGSLEGFKVSPDPSQPGYPNGNVKWQLETKRAHAGKGALYFGNECGTYDPEMTGASGCKEGAASKAMFVTLKREVNIPAGEQYLLHYWMWLDTQPPLTKLHYTQVAATADEVKNCAPVCAANSLCVKYVDGPNTGKFACVKKNLDEGTCPAPCGAGTTCTKIDTKTSQCLTENDVVTVKINDETPPIFVSTEIDKSTKGAWKHFLVNLAKYAGKSANISWEFKTDAARNTYEGIYLDDVVIESMPTCNLCDDKSPCGDDKKACTEDACSPFQNLKGSGLCMHDLKPQCCDDLLQCDDKNDCTVDACNKPDATKPGLCSNKPDIANANCCKAENLFTDGFESGTISTWEVKDSNSQTVKWQVNKTGGVGGGTALSFSGPDLKSYADPALKQGPAGRICTGKTYKLSSATVYNRLTFQLNMATEWTGKKPENYKNPPIPGEPKVDYLDVEVKVAGVLHKVWSSDSIQGTTEDKFESVQVDLNKFGGKEVQLCFYFDAGDATGNGYAGVTIDDVKIDIACTPAVICTTDADAQKKCAAKDCHTVKCAAGECLYDMVPDCCAKDIDCDDADACTTDTCKAPKCDHALKSPTCCTDKASFTADFEKSVPPNLPNNWKVTVLPGNALNGKPYDTTVKWNATNLWSASGQYSLYFGNNGTYNAGANAVGGIARGPDIAIPPNGTALLTFDLKLSTEWDPDPKEPNKKFVAPPQGIVVDRLRVGLYDPKEADPKKNSIWVWDSYAIEGTTAGKKLNVVAQVPDAWKGKIAKFQVEFDSGGDKNNTFEGAYLDNVTLATVCDKPACLSDAACIPAEKPDPCKKYFCSSSKAGTKMTFACNSDFKGGPNCCAPGSALPVETFESGTLGTAWVGTCDAGITQVKWQTVAKKYLQGNYEAYLGNKDKWNYADGALAIKCQLCTAKAVELSTDVKKEAILQWKAWIDVEQSFEQFKMTATTFPGGQKQTKIVWAKNDPDKPDKPLGLAPGEYKVAIEKKNNLSEFKGKGPIIFCFEFDSFDSKNNDKYSGIFLDDITIVEPCL
jgi:hypothetical protein